MPDNQDGGTKAAVTPPVVDQEAIKAAVADALRPVFSAEITGAVKRQVASEVERALAAAKADADASKDGDKGKGKVDPRDMELTKLREKVERFEKDHAAALRDARAGKVAETLTAWNGRLTKSGQEFLSLALGNVAVRMEDGAWVAKEGDSVKPLATYADEWMKDRKDLLVTAARQGSGAGQSAVFSEPMPTSRTALLFHPTEKRPDGRPKETPERKAAFVATYGMDAWNRLPK